MRKLLDAYISIWNERDQDARRMILSTVFTPDAEYVDPNLAVQGHPAIDAYVEAWQRQSPGMVFQLGEARGHHDIAHFYWTFGHPDEPPAAAGWDVAALTHDRISKIQGFFEQSGLLPT